VTKRFRRIAATVPALALAVGGLALTGAAPTAAVQPSQAAPAGGRTPSLQEHYINYAPPRVQSDVSLTDEKVSPPGMRRTALLTRQIDRKFSGGNPLAAKALAERERQAVATGRNPSDFLYKRAKTTKTAKLLTLLVEFNDQANDDFSGWSHPKTIYDVDDCVTEPPGTKLNGPLHNQIPNPAHVAGGGKDNNSMWVPDFSPAHYHALLYSSTGITQRVRTDLRDPRDGKPGIDISGYTLKNMYEELSKGAYTVTGQVVGWIKVPHSEAWYGAGRCGTYPQDMAGHPDNPLGPAQLAIDAVNAFAAQNPSFPWADYDREDPADADGDGNVDEPDGVIDHLVLIHAGVDKSAGGGAEGPPGSVPDPGAAPSACSAAGAAPADGPSRSASRHPRITIAMTAATGTSARAIRPRRRLSCICRSLARGSARYRAHERRRCTPAPLGDRAPLRAVSGRTFRTAAGSPLRAAGIKTRAALPTRCCSSDSHNITLAPPGDSTAVTTAARSLSIAVGAAALVGPMASSAAIRHASRRGLLRAR